MPKKRKRLQKAPPSPQTNLDNDDSLLTGEDPQARVARLEEEVMLYTTMLKSLQDRKHDVAKELEDVLSKKQKYEVERGQCLNIKEQLEADREEQVKKLKEMEKNLRKSRERLKLLNSNQPVFLTQEEYEEMELNTNQVEQLVTTTAPAVSQILPEQRLVASFQDIQHDHEKMLDYWSTHSAHGLMTFLPSLNSEWLIRKLLEVCVREILALDAKEPNGSHRRQSMLYTCLDVQQLTVKRNILKQEKECLTWNPIIALCPYELGGVCADQLCPYQHVEGRGSRVTKIVARERLPLPPLKLPKRPQEIESTESQLDQSVIQSSSDSDDSDSEEENSDTENFFKRQQEQGKATKEVQPSSRQAPPTQSLSSSPKKETKKETAQPFPSGNASDKDSDSEGGVPISGPSGPMEVTAEGGQMVRTQDEGDRPAKKSRHDRDLHLGEVIVGASEEVVVENLGDESADEASHKLNRSDEFSNNTDHVPLPPLPTAATEHVGDDLVETFFDKSVKTRTSRLWWMADHYSDNEQTGAPMSVTDWLYVYGKFRITKVHEKKEIFKNNETSWSLEYRREYPTNNLQLIKFIGRVISSTQVAIHSGRFDVSRSLHKVAAHVVEEFKRTRLPASTDLFSADQTTVALLRRVLTFVELANEAGLKYDSRPNNMFFVAFETQMLLSTVATFVYLFHVEYMKRTGELDEEEHQRWDLLLQKLGASFLKKNEKHVDRDKTDRVGLISKIRLSLREAILSVDEVIARPGSSDSEGGISQSFNLQVLLDNIELSQSLFRDVSEIAEMRSLVETILRPTWSVVRRFVQDTVNTSSRSWLCLRASIIFGHIVLGALEGVANGVIADELNTSTIATLSEVDANLHMMLNSMRHAMSDVPLMDVLITPLFAANMTLAFHLGLYAKAQRRLEKLLGAEDRETRGDSSMALTVYSELLWSQVVQFRTSLPYHQDKVNENDEWELPPSLFDGHRMLACRISEYGVHLHHVCIEGDWNIVRKLCEVDEEVQSKKKKSRKDARADIIKSCYTMMPHLFPSKPVDKGALVNLKTVDLLFRAGSGTSLLRSPFPRSVLIMGSAIERLQLRSCYLEVLPLSFGCYFPKLLELDLSSNKLRSLPESFKKLTTLKCLLLNKNKLTSIPMGKCLDLLLLRASQNQLQILPHDLKYSTYVEALDLAKNQLTMTESDLIVQFPKLRTIKLKPQYSAGSIRGISSTQGSSLHESSTTNSDSSYNMFARGHQGDISISGGSRSSGWEQDSIRRMREGKPFDTGSSSAGRRSAGESVSSGFGGGSSSREATDEHSTSAASASGESLDASHYSSRQR